MVQVKNSQDRCILFFLKYPQKGQVKTRLTIQLDEDFVVQLYQCFVRDLLSTLTQVDASLFLCYSPKNSQEKFKRWLGEQYQYFLQTGNDLGDRMKNAFIQAFTKRFHTVLLIGSDSPDLPPLIFQEAFSFLQTNDIVIGPTGDGGYYLLGFQSSTFFSEIFDDIAWSTPFVFQKTIQKIYDSGKTVHLLPQWDDVDTIDDVKKLMQRNHSTPFRQSNTMSLLLNSKNKVLLVD